MAAQITILDIKVCHIPDMHSFHLSALFITNHKHVLKNPQLYTRDGVVFNMYDLNSIAVWVKKDVE